MIPAWNEFFSTLAQISISLAALLFVSLQITREKWITKSARKLIAFQTLLEFLIPSFVAFIALMPAEPLHIFGKSTYYWQIAGILGAILGLAISLLLLRLGLFHYHTFDAFIKNQVKYQGFALLEYLIVLGASLYGQLVLLSLVMIWLLISGSVETWLFFGEHSTD